jgi:hypothetical protein
LTSSERVVRGLRQNNALNFADFIDMRAAAHMPLNISGPHLHAGMNRAAVSTVSWSTTAGCAYSPAAMTVAYRRWRRPTACPAASSHPRL